MNYAQLNDNMFLISGPCVIESRDVCMTVAEHVKRITERLGITYIFKGSYRKANRSSIHSFTGIGDQEALRILEEVGNSFDIPVTTDIHTAQEADLAAEVVDILQIPAFLCRQTDILLSAAKTGKIVNVKKGQFLSPDAMIHACNKIASTDNHNILLTERGTTFGYQDLIVDMCAFPIMKKFGYPVIMDCTHALQRPNQSAGVTGGRPEFIATMINASIASGANGLFIETHPEPRIAKSDGANMLQLDKLETILEQGLRIYEVVNQK